MITQPRHYIITKNELAILKGLADGKTYVQIGAEIGYSTSRLKGFMRDLLPKLGARNRTHAVAIAYRRGIIE